MNDRDGKDGTQSEIAQSWNGRKEAVRSGDAQGKKNITAGRGKSAENDPADFTRGSIPGKIIRFMLPVLGALILQAAYGAVDLLVVGRFGTTAGLSGVSTGSQILNLITLMITGSAMAITVLMSRYIGEKHPEKIGRLLGAGLRCMR